MPATIAALAKKATRYLTHAEDSRRAGSALDALADLTVVQVALDDLRTAYVRTARDAGHSWDAIGGHLGVSAQAAHKRYAEDLA